MHNIYIIADNIFSPLGSTTSQNFDALKKGKTAIKKHNDQSKSDIAFHAAIFESVEIKPGFTKFEQLLIHSISDVLDRSLLNISSEKTLLIISSTKGNISLLETQPISPSLKEQIAFSASAKKIQQYFGLKHIPLVVSHACISGLVALITARRLLLAGKYENIIVAGADVISKFVLSGFQSFHAVSDGFCKPFDANRNGINLGEAAASVLLSVNKPQKTSPIVHLNGGAISNDANHISGPSRTGEELAEAIQKALLESNVAPKKIDFISAHGTATVYNDDMESRAITLNQLQQVPLNSLKGYYGHTLGAAGLLETIISVQSLRENIMIPTKGFEIPGTAEPVNVCKDFLFQNLNYCLKTASGFGGCNAAIVLGKE